MNTTTNDAKRGVTDSGLNGTRPRMTPVDSATAPGRHDEGARAESTFNGATADSVQAASTASLAALAAGVVARLRQIRNASDTAARELHARNAHD
jgi:hypothetical protein